MTHARFDGEALRLERLARLQAAMSGHGVDVCVLNPIGDQKAVRKVVETVKGALDGLDRRQSGVLRATR